MKLKGTPTGFWMTNFSLHLNDQPWGECRWKELHEIQLVDGRLMLVEEDSHPSQLRLRNAKDDKTLAVGGLISEFSGTWELQLSVGSVLLKPIKGLFKTDYLVTQGSRTLAEVKNVSFMKGIWLVESHDTLKEMDLLLIGLIYHSLMKPGGSGNDP